jgi:hypothetical protein
MTREHYIYEDVKMETIILLVNMWELKGG